MSIERIINVKEHKEADAKEYEKRWRQQRGRRIMSNDYHEKPVKEVKAGKTENYMGLLKFSMKTVNRRQKETTKMGN